MERILLNGKWSFKDVKGEVIKKSLPAKVPGVVHIDLSK